MDKSRDHVEAFPQEIRQLQVTAGPSSPGDAAEAWISQQPTPVPEAGTCQEQRGALFHTQEGETSQSRRVNIYQHLPSLEEHEPGAGSDERQQHSIDVKQLEDKETQVDMKTNREAVKRQRQLTRQMMEAVEQQWDESQTQRNEIAFLRTKTEQQHRDINRLTAENHEQFTATKALTLKMEKVIEKLKENKSEAAQEKMQLLKIQAEIDQERKTLDTQRCNLEMIKYGESKEESETHKVLTIKQNQEMTERLRADRLLRAIHEAKLAKEQLERSIKDINQELQISKNYISEHKSHIEDVKRNFNLYINKMKQKWTRNPSDSEMQRVPEVEQRVRYQERQDTSDSVRVKLGKIWEEMEKGWDALEDDERRLEMTVTEKLELKPDLGESTGQEMKANIEQDRKTLDRDRQLAKAEMDELKSMRESNERLKQELEERFQKTRREIRELEVLNNEIEMKKKELAKMIRLSKKNKEMKKETEHATQDVKDRQDTMAEQVETPEVNPAVMQKVIFDVQETRKLLHMIREDAQHRKRVLAEEVKWENFQQKKKKRKLEQWLEKTTKERDELEIMKIQMQRRREEDEQKHKDTITTLGMMGDVKDNIEKAVTEISNTREEMLKAQRQMEKNKDDVRTFMDKLSSLRAWASRWISTESAIRNSFSGNKSQLQTSQRATHRESHMEQTQEVPADEEHRVEGEIAQAGVSFQYRDKEHRHLFSVEKQSLYVQIQTEIYEETLIDDDLMTNLREREEMEKQIFRLRESEAELKEQIKSHMEVIEEKNQEIKNLILDIMELQRQRPEPEKDLVTNVERLLPETKSRDSLWGNRHEIDTYELAPQVPDENQKRNQETKSDLQTCREEIDGKDTTERRDLQSLGAEISRTQEIMRSIQLEVKTQPGNVDADKDPDYEEGEIEGLLQDIKEFQEFLRMVKKRLDEETGNMKSVKMGARKQKRELEQRLEKTLRERDTLDLLKIQMQKQSGVIEEKMERIAKVKSTMEKMAVKTRNKSDNIHCIIKECELNLRHLEEISFKFTATEHNFQTSYLSLTLLRAELENIKNQIRKDTGKGDKEKYKTEMDKPAKKVKYKALKLRVDKEELETYTTLIVDSCDEKNRDGEILQQQRDGETETGEIARQQAEAEKHLKESMERQRQELEDTAQTTKREIREMELLKSELEIKRKDCVRALRKLAIMRNEIQNEKGSLRRETKKKQRQLDQRLEKIMRERDELEVMKNKLQQEKNELCAQKIVKCKMANQSSEVINSQNTRQKLHILLEMIRRETEILKNMNVVLEKQTEGLKALQGENRNIRDNMNTIKLQIKTAFNKLTEQASAEMNQTVQMRDDVQKQRHDLDIRLEEVKRERRETEVLQTELEFKKRECQQMIRKGIRKHQEVKQMWDEIKEKKDAFKWETRKRKKELDQKLETIIREQDELEIMRLKLRREKDESEQQRTSGITNDENLLQNHWGLINICMEKCKDIKRHSEDLNEAIMEEKRNISAQGKIITEAKKDMELMKVNIKSKKGIMMHALKNMQQEQTHLEQLEMKDKSVSVKEKCVEEPEEGTMRDKDLEKENVFKAETFTVTIKEDKLLQIQKDEPQEMNKGEKKKSKKKIVVSDIVRQRQDMENQLESDALLEKADLVKLKAELDHEREDLERMNEMMNQEKMNLELMMSDIQRQNDQLQQDMKVEKEKLENAKTELQKTKEDNVKLFEEISQEKTNIKDLNVQVQEQRNNLEDVIGKMTLQQKEQELHDDTIRRLKQELETSEKSRLRERTELELLRENTNKTKEKVETAMSSINGERENLSHMKNEIEKEREKVLNEKENLEREGSELIRKEDEVLNKMKDIGILKVKLQQLNERMNDNIKQKTEILQQNKDDTLLLYTALEEQLTKLDGQKEKLVCFTELFGRDKDALISLMSDTVIQKEDIETQSKQKFMNEKLQLDKLKAELKEEREDLDRANEKMNNSKLEFERMKTDIKQQTDQLEQGRRDMEMTKTEIQKMKEHADSLFDEIKRDKTNINDLKLQVQEQIDKRFDERDELDILRKGVRNKKHEVEAAMKNIREDREHFNQMKADIDKEREILMNQKHIMEEQWSELKMRENEVMNEMKSMKSLKARLQQLNERISEDVKNKFIRLEQNKDEILKLVSVLKQNYEALDAQTITMTCFTEKLAKEREGLMSVMSEFVRKRQDIESQLEPVTFLEKEDLLNLKAELDQKREDMERMSEMMNQEKMDLELMRSDIQRQSDQFKPDINVEKEKLEIAKTELQKTQEHNVKLFEEISQEKTNIEDLKVQVQEQRNELEDVIGKMTLQQKEQELHDDTIRRLKQELETSENSRVRERTELELLRNEKDKLERENSELIRREDEVLNKMKDIEILKVKLQQLNERNSVIIKHKMKCLQQNKEDTQLLYTALEEQLTKLDGQKEKLASSTEMLSKEKESLISLLSDIVIQKEDIENVWKRKFLNEKLHLDKLKAELQEEREHLDRANEKMNNSKLEFEQMKTDIKRQTDQLEQGRRDMEMTKTEIQKMKEHTNRLFDEINRDKTNINDLKCQVQEQIDKRFDERDELDNLRKGVRNKKREVEAAMKNIREEREHFNQMKADIDKEREILMNQKHIMEEQWSELKMREDEVIIEFNSMKSLKARLQELNERISEDVKNKFIRLEQNKDEILKLVSVLKQNYEALDAQTITMTCYTEKLAKEREGLMSVLSEIVRQRQDMESQLEPVTFLEKEDLLNLKAELDQKREDMERMSEMMNQEKMDLELMRSDIQRQSDQFKHDINVEKEKLAITKTELQKRQEHNVKLFEEISQEKTNIEELKVQVQEQRKKLEDVIGKMTLQQKEQELHDDTIRRLKQELETSENSRLRERTELELLKNEKDKLERENSELIRREDEVLNKMKDIGILKVKLQQLNERMSEIIKQKMESLQQNKEDTRLLYTALEEQLIKLDGQKEKLVCFTELFGRDKDALISLLSDTVIQKDDIELKYLNEKLHLDKLKAELKEEREDLDRANEKMNNSKLEFEQMKTDIKQQTDQLEQGRRDMEMTKTERQKMKEHSDRLFDEINRDKTNINDLKLQVQEQRDKLYGVLNSIAMKQKEQEQKEDDIRRQNQEVQHHMKRVLIEREELDILRKDVENKQHEVEAAMNNIKEEREHFSQMKADIDKERETLTSEKDRIGEQWSELKMRENEIMNEIKSLEFVKARLQELNERISEDMKNKVIRLEQNNYKILTLVNVLEQKHKALDAQKQTITCYTEKLAREKEGLRKVLSEMIRQRQDMVGHPESNTFLDKEDLTELKDQKTEDMERMNEMMNQDKLDLEMMRSAIQRQSDRLRHDITKEKEKLEITMTELQKKKADADRLFGEINEEKNTIKDLKLQAQERRDKLEYVKKMISKQKEQELHDDTIRRLKQDLESSENSRVKERTEFELLKKKINKTKGEAEAAMSSINVEREHLSHRKNEIEKERENILNEKENLERENSELIRREDEVLNKMRDIGFLKVKLQQLNERMSENMKQRTESLQQNKEDTRLLYTALEEQLTKLDGQKEKLVCFTELFGRDKDALISLLSDTVIQKEDIELKYLNEKLHLDKLKAELKEEREELSKHNETIMKEISDFELMKADIKQQSDLMEQVCEQRDKLKDVINSIALKQKAQEEKGDDVRRQKQELQNHMNRVLAERQELDVLRKDVKNQQHEVEAAMNNIKEEREHFSQMKADIDKERETLLKEKDIIKGQMCELEAREYKIMSEMKTLESLRARLHELKERTSEDVKNKITKLEQNEENLLKLVSVLEQKHEALDAQKLTVTGYTEKLATERESLRSLWSEMVRERRDMEGHKTDQVKLKTKVDNKREDLERMNEAMKEPISSDIQKQHDLKEDKEKLEITKAELQKLKEHAGRLLHDINRHKTNIKDLNLQVQAQRDKLQEVFNTIALKQKEQERKYEEVRRQFQQLQTHMSRVFAEREVLRQELSQKNQELDRINRTASEKRELDRIRPDIATKIKTFQQDVKERIEDIDLQSQKKTTHAVLDQINRENMKIKDQSLQFQKFKNVVQMIAQKLQEHKLDHDETQGQVQDLETTRGKEEGEENIINQESQVHMKRRNDTADKEEGLISMIEQREDMEKLQLDKLKAELKEEREDLDKERVNLKLMKSNNETETEKLEQDKKDVEEQKDELGITILEMNHEKERLCQMMATLDREKERFIHEKQGMKEEACEHCLNTMAHVRAKLGQLTQRTRNVFRKSTDNLEHKIVEILELTSVLEHECCELDTQRRVIAGYCEVMQKHVGTKTFDQAVQTEDFKKREESQVVVTDIEGESKDLKIVVESSPEQGDKTSRRESLRKIWKDTKKDRKEIDHMVFRGNEMRHNLERRLKVVNQFVKRTLFQKEKTEEVEQEPASPHTTSKSHWEKNQRALDQKYAELQQLKTQMLGEIEKLRVKETASRAQTTTSDKANQTSRVDVATAQTTQQASTETHEHTVFQSQAASEALSGLFGQLRHYCCQCCCPCCASCEQVCEQEEK